jgi:hypothetical protein
MSFGNYKIDEDGTVNRDFKIFRKEEYAYKNTSCIKSISVKRNKSNKHVNNCILAINNVGILPSLTTPTQWMWDFGFIRDEIRDLLGEDKRETELIALESTFVYNALRCVQHYTLPTSELKNIVFTSALRLQFVPEQEVDMLDANEIVYASDVQKSQSSKSSSSSVSSNSDSVSESL